MAVGTKARWEAQGEDWRQARRADERRMFARFAVERTPAARDAIVERFMPLARQLARRYRNVGDLDDLEQIAAIGLLKAIDRFDPERGLAFSSFAFPTIVGELKRYLRDHGWSVRPPRRVQELTARLDHDARDLFGELGRSPTVAELAARAESTVEQVLEAMQAGTARRAVSLDHPRHDDDPNAPGLEVAVDEAGFEAAEDTALLDSVLRILPERERLVLQLRFKEDLTQARIGEIVGVSQMHVSRMIRTALHELHTVASNGAP